MPESIRICGEFTAPAERMISRPARTRRFCPFSLSSTATALLFSMMILWVSAWVSTVKLGRASAGLRNAFEVLQRRPRRMVKS